MYVLAIVNTIYLFWRFCR